MKPFVCVYSEGNDLKLAVVSKENDILKVHSTSYITMSDFGKQTTEESVPSFNLGEVTDDLSFDNLAGDDSFSSAPESSNVVSEIGLIASALSDIKLNQAQFIPVVTDPTVNFHIFENEANIEKSKLQEAIIKDIQSSKGINVAKDYIDYVEIDEKQYLAVFVENAIPGVDLINSLATFNNRRYYKVNTIKNAEVALANYVSKTNKFFPEDYSLIIYTGRESSKLIFLEGQKLKHIGTTLDIGTQNLHTYDVYFSKILLEMENGGIPRLDNVVLCGDDRSENLVLSFYGTFPEANVIELKFDQFDSVKLNEEEKENLSAFAIPLAAAYEFYAEQNKELSGINILPKYILENQKFLQFGWHSYALLPVLFAATYYFTLTILSGFSTINELDSEIRHLKALEKQNQQILDEIYPLSNKISSFDKTQAILDSAAVGAGDWSDMLEKVSTFVERRQNFWVSHLESDSETSILIKGYSLSRSVLTDFSEYSNSAILQNILYEPLRENNAFQYTINFELQKKSEE